MSTADWPESVKALARHTCSLALIHDWKLREQEFECEKRTIEETIKPTNPRLARRKIRELKRELFYTEQAKQSAIGMTMVEHKHHHYLDEARRMIEQLNAEGTETTSTVIKQEEDDDESTASMATKQEDDE